MPVIYPAPGGGPELARLLLSMVDNPDEVAVTNEGGLGFVVSAEVEQIWLDSLRPPEAPVAVPVPPPESVPQSEPVRKNRKKE